MYNHKHLIFYITMKYLPKHTTFSGYLALAASWHIQHILVYARMLNVHVFTPFQENCNNNVIFVTS